MKKIVIKQKIQSFGFTKAAEHSYDGVVFPGGQITYVNGSKQVCAARREDELIEALKSEPGCLSVEILQKKPGKDTYNGDK